MSAAPKAPAAKPKAPVDPVVKRCRTIWREYRLQRIDLTLTDHGVTARAMPLTFNRLVEARREKAFDAYNIAHGGTGSISLAEAEAIMADAMRPVGAGRGGTIDAALDDMCAAIREAYAQAGIEP